MDLIVTLLVGALVGWLASIIMHSDGQMGALWNVLAGIFGAWIARALFGDILGIGSASFAGQFSLMGILWGIVGAIVIIAIARLINIIR